MARFKANFTNKLNSNDDPDTSVQPKELWVDVAIDGTSTGTKNRVSDDTLVQLLLASDASISTYLTLVYEGDENPIKSIYRDLPLSSLSSASSGSSISRYFSSLFAGYSNTTMPTPNAANNWVDSGGNVYITSGNVGIGTTGPDTHLDIDEDTLNTASILSLSVSSNAANQPLGRINFANNNYASNEVIAAISGITW